jgi:phosphonate transport system ATP-binding protein
MQSTNVSTDMAIAPPQHATSLRILGLHKSYRAGKPVLKGIDLYLQGAGLTAVIGPSGTGKSTLIRCINRLVDPSGGRIELDWGETPQNMAALSGRALRLARRHVGMVFQEYNLVERLSVMENVLTGRLGYLGAWQAWRRKFSDEDIAQALVLLREVGLSDFVSQRADALSGGQRQRVGIARALMQRPALLLADEPTSSLDPKTSVEIMELLREQGRARGIPVIANMHDVELARRYADQIIGMAGGQIVYQGPAQGLSDAVLKQVYGGASWLQ